MVLLSGCTTSRDSAPKTTPSVIGCNEAERIAARVDMLVAKARYEQAVKDPESFKYMQLPADQILKSLRKEYDEKLKQYQFWEDHVQKHGHIHNFILDTTTKPGQPASDHTESTNKIPQSEPR